MDVRQLLLIRSSQPENAFGRFTGEILKSEGLSGFDTHDLDSGDFPEVRAGDLLVLTRCFLRPDEMTRLLAGVEAGARLVCLQPSWKLAHRLGWQSRYRVLHPGWVKIRDGVPGCGLPLQTHVPITVYRPPESGEWEALADAVLPDWSDGGCPAVARQRLGEGKVVLFFYDLPAAVARIRFGNPELASYLTNGFWGWPHACDLFSGHIDERVHQLPQADLHGQLLARVLTDICSYPLARLWYYPETRQRAAAVFQSDDDWSTPEQFAELAGMLQEHGATGTFYLVEDTLLPDETMAGMREEGHTFAPHVVSAEVTSEGKMIDQETDWYFAFPASLERETASFDVRYGGHSATLQCHCAPWYGYQELVPLHQRLGYRLLFTYMSAPAQHLNRYMCGSGRPLRFIDRTGTLRDCWQQPLVTYDDASIKAQVQADPRPVIADFTALLESALTHTHTAVPILSHPVSFATYSRPYITACFDQLVSAGVPIFNGDRWLDFVSMRDGIRVSQHLANDTLSCTVSGLSGPLPLMIPLHDGDELPEVSVNGEPYAAAIAERLTQRYAFIQLVGAADGSDIEITIVQSQKVELA